MRTRIELLCLTVLCGCSFTTMSPARKLAKGDIVVQGAIDEPGVVYIPRVSGGMTFGTGGGDLGFHVGTTLFTVNGGATGRYYFGEHGALSLQADFAITPTDVALGDSARFGFLTINSRVGRVLTSPSEHFYGGFQVLGIAPFNVDEDVDLPSGFGVGVGGYVGLATPVSRRLDVQVELSAAPVGTFPGLVEDSDRYTLTALPIAQIGIAIQYRAEKNPAPAEPTLRPIPERSIPRDPQPIL